MSNLLRVLEVVLPSIYAVCSTVYLARFVFGRVIAPRSSRHPVLVALVAHALYMLIDAGAHGRCPLLSMRGGLLFLAFSMLLSYIALERSSRQRTTGFVVLPLAWLVLVAGLCLEPARDFLRQQQAGPWLHLHAALALLGVAAMMISAVHAALYLVLHHDLKTGNFGLSFERLPPLETLERLTLKPARMGVALFLAGGLLGGVLMRSQQPLAAHADPKLVAAALALVAYLLTVLGAWSGRLRGRALALGSLAGFIFLCVSLGIPFVSDTFHKFF